MPILGTIKTLMYEFCYYYIKPSHQDNAKLCYMNTDSFIIHIKTGDFYQNIANDVEKQFDRSNYDKHDKIFSNRNKQKSNWFI